MTESAMEHDAIVPIAVLGAGFGGLASALSLASRGHEVHVFDQKDGPGGKAYQFFLGPYRFDAGPSLFTMRDYFERLFAESGVCFQDYVETVELDPITRYVFADGSHMNSRPKDGFLDEVSRLAPEQRTAMSDYLEYSRRLLEISEAMFLRSPLSQWRKGGFVSALKNLMKLGRMDVLRSMHKANASYVQDPRLVQLLDRFATYNGSNPYKAPAALNCIAWVEHGRPVYGLRQGIAAIPQAIERRARELGTRFHYGAKVASLVPPKRQGALFHIGFQDGSRIRARKVVSNIDVSQLYEHVLHERHRPAARRYRRLKPSSSAVVFFWGISGQFDKLLLHNIYFSGDYRREFRQIHNHGRLPEDPTIYLNISSKCTAEDAPEGCESWFVMVNAPAHQPGRDWTREVADVRKRVIHRLESDLQIDGGLERLIVEQRILTPADIERETGSYRGSLYGISSNSRSAAFLRHPNRSPYHPGLYHCGGSCHPGGGMPLALSSGIIAADLLIEDEISTK